MNPNGRQLSACGAVLLAMSVGLAGCSKSNVLPAAPTVTSSASTATVSSTNATSADGALVTAKKSGISFRVPAGWEVLDSDRINAIDPAEIPDWVTKLAVAFGMPPDRFATALKKMDAWAMSKESGSFASYLSVIYPRAGGVDLAHTGAGNRTD